MRTIYRVEMREVRSDRDKRYVYLFADVHITGRCHAAYGTPLPERAGKQTRQHNKHFYLGASCMVENVSLVNNIV